MTGEERTREKLAAEAEALLFTEGNPLPKKRLASLLSCSPEELEGALALLRARQGGGTTLIATETTASLAVSPEASEIIRRIHAKELERDIGDAGLEVLSIVLYRGPSTRSSVEYIRGVNSGATIRTLLSRGLLERAENPEDAREVLYRPTAELLAHIGITDLSELPEYATITAELAAFEKSADTFHGTDTTGEN